VNEPALRLSGVHRDLWRAAFDRGVRGWTFLVILLGLAAGLAAIGQALALSHLVHLALFPGVLGAPFGLPPEPALALGWLLALGVVRALLAGGSEAAAHRLAARVKENLRARLLASLRAAGLAGRQEERLGELVATLSDGVESIEGYYVQYLPQVIFALSLPLLVVGVVLRFDWLSGLILLVTGPLIPLFLSLIGQASAALTRRQWMALGRMSAFFFDLLQGLPTLRLLGQDAQQARRMAQVSQRYREATLAVLRVTFLSALVLELLSTLSVAVVAVQIGLRLLYQQMDFLPAFFILVLAPEYYLPLRQLSLRFHAGAAGAAAAEGLFARLHAQPAQPLSASAAPPLLALPSEPPTISLEGITFAYPDGTPVLRDLACRLPGGEVTVLAGASGVGKSTLAGLLLGFWRPVRGTLQVNGQVVERLPWPVGWASQHPYLFQGSVAENIGLGRPGASQVEIEEAARFAGAHEFITRLPETYATLLGERGLRLSGGQAQRIALARAMISRSPLMIFDEPTAHLDAASAAAVWRGLASLAGRHTILVITHQLEPVLQTGYRPAQLLVLRDGQAMPLSVAQAQAALAGAQAVPWQAPSPASKAEALSAGRPLPPQRGQPPDQRARPAAFLLSLLTPEAGQVGLSALLGFAAVASGAGLMATAAFLLSRAAWPATIADLQVAIVGVRFFGLGRAVFRYLERLASHGATLSVLARLRARLYAAIVPLSPARLVGAHHSGSLLNQMTTDITALESFFVRAVAPPLAAGLLAAALGWFLGAWMPRLALVVLGLLALNGILLPILAWRRWCEDGPRLVAARSALKVHLVDWLQGLPDWLALGRESDFEHKALQAAAALDRAAWRGGQLNALFNAANLFLSNLAAWCALVLALPLAESGAISPLVVGALALAAQAVFEAVQPLPLAGQQLAADQAAAQRLLDVCSQAPAVDEGAGRRLPSRVTAPAHLAVDRLVFAYEEAPAAPPALDGLSLELRTGQVCALLGPSGAGKSTLANLLLRFWEYAHGSIRINGEELRSLQAAEVRALFAVAPQRIHFFTATVRDNLRLARPSASDADLLAALDLAGLAEFVRGLPDGLDTWLGAYGMRLSGGERQRLALARALLQDAPFVLLDEPAAHLDPPTARQVLGDLVTHLRPQHGILLLTHALDAQLAHALQAQDAVVVLEQGQVRWRGTWQDYRLRAGS
jgi:ATP-binding cassette subfamily C protein CydCD